MPKGRTRATASATLSGVSPPARRISRCAAMPAAAVQSMVRPVPPRATGSWTSSSSLIRAGHARVSTPSSGTTLITTTPCRERAGLCQGNAPTGQRGRYGVHVVQRLVDENANGRDERRQLRRDRARAVRIDEARALRPEHEADRARAGRDRRLRILQPCDAADFYDHGRSTFDVRRSSLAGVRSSASAASTPGTPTKARSPRGSRTRMQGLITSDPPASRSVCPLCLP